MCVGQLLRDFTITVFHSQSARACVCACECKKSFSFNDEKRLPFISHIERAKDNYQVCIPEKDNVQVISSRLQTFITDKR